MSATVQVIYQSHLNISEIPDSALTPGLGLFGSSLYFDAYNLDTVVGGTGAIAPAPSSIINVSFTAVAANTDFDLTAAPPARDITQTIDLTGKKLMYWIFKTPITNNAAGIILKEGAATPYFVLGQTADRFTIFPGEHRMGGIVAGGTLRTQAVSALNKLIRFTGTVGDVLQGFMVFG